MAWLEIFRSSLKYYFLLKTWTKEIYFLQRNKSEEIVNNWFDVKIRKVHIFSRKVYMFLNQTCRNRKRNYIIRQIYHGCFTIWLKIIKIHYSDYITKVFDHRSFGLQFFGPKFEKRWAFRVSGPFIIRVPDSTFRVPGLGSQTNCVHEYYMYSKLQVSHLTVFDFFQQVHSRTHLFSFQSSWRNSKKLSIHILTTICKSDF